LPSLEVPAPPERTIFQQFQAGHGYGQLGGSTGTLSDDTTTSSSAPSR